MRIGIDGCCWSNKRGYGRFTRELLKALASVHHTNDYALFIDDEKILNNIALDGFAIKHVSTQYSATEAASADGRRSMRDLCTMSREVLRHDFDLFFFPAVYTYYPVLNRTKKIITIHDMTPRLHPEKIFPSRKLRLFWNLKEYLAVRQADLILTVSEHSKQGIMRFYKLPDSRVKVITEGPKEVFKILSGDGVLAEVLLSYQLDPSERYLLYVGGISPHKNLETLLLAYSELIKNNSFSDLKLVLVGDYKNDAFYSSYPGLQELVTGHGLENKIILTGYVPDRHLTILYNAALLLVFPSLQEGFGLPAVEAMVCGTPVVASNAGSLPEIVGDAGRFFDPHSQQGMFDALKEVLSDGELRENMRGKGLERAKQFSWEKAAKDLLTIFDNLVNGYE